MEQSSIRKETAQSSGKKPLLRLQQSKLITVIELLSIRSTVMMMKPRYAVSDCNGQPTNQYKLASFTRNPNDHSNTSARYFNICEELKSNFVNKSTKIIMIHGMKV